jgi:beta-xylosidase
MQIHKKIMTYCWMVLSISGYCFAQHTESCYRNPVIAGDFPDPTLVRVGNDYYAAGTSGDYAPVFPLYHSGDLINWNMIGHIFNEPPAWIQGDCWAPELFHDNGRYFVYYTARKKENGVSCIGVATTADITKGFDDHGVIIEWGREAIDAFIFKDDDGKRYILWKAYGLDGNRPVEILCSELSDDGLTLQGKAFTLTDPETGWKGRGDEGACLLKHRDYYYLFYAVGGCCDRACDYRVCIARTKSLKGKWEQYEKNPLLQGGETWRCPGHGTVVQTPDDRYFFLYHAYHTRDFNFTGRQALLDEICFDDTSDYPYFRFGTTPSSQAPTPLALSIQRRSTGFYDDFLSGEKDKFWSWDMKSPKPITGKNNGVLTVTATGKTFCFRGMSLQTGNSVIETSVLNDEWKNFKGLCLYGNDKNMLLWGLEGMYLKLYRIENEVKTALFSQRINMIETGLKIEILNVVAFRFGWSENGENWTYFPKSGEAITAAFLPQWGKGVRAGIAVEDNGNNTGNFSFFAINSR